MSKKERFLYGGLGACIPMLLQLLQVDAKLMFVGFSTVVFAGYVVRSVVLFALGGTLAAAHKNGVSPLQLIQLGMAAPALLLSFVNGQNVQLPSTPAMSQIRIVSYADAATVSPAVRIGEWEVKEFRPPERSFKQAIFSQASDQIYFIVYHESSDIRDIANTAIAIRDELKHKNLNIQPSIYTPPDHSRYFITLGGEYLSEKQMIELHGLLDQNEIHTRTWDVFCMCYLLEAK